ncbi:MAG: hypothetical protein NTW35_01670 [Candidatus Nomurabacteria bacterium]|nr:hypothetical protein [Candidatus Nomurabacteria bacterium]
MIKEITTGKLGRQKSPTVAPGTHCPIPEDKTFTNMALFNASLTGGLVPVPEFGLEAKVTMSKEISDGHYVYQLVISETVINLRMQACLTWGIPQSERPKLEMLKSKPLPKTKSKH